MTQSGHIRADRIRGTESLYGPSRSHRPRDVNGHAIVCPFCPGNEGLTGALLIPDPGPAWKSRVVANLYPAVMEPAGRHEVIIEMRAHDAVWTALERSTVERVLRLYRDREAAAYADGYAFAAIFKNSGAPAGASLRHPHTQVLALRDVPRSIATRLERLTDVCGFCETTGAGAERIVLRTPEIVAYVPDGSRTAFEVRLGPVAHASRFCESSDALLGALAQALCAVMKRLAATLGEGVPFNLFVQSAPGDARARTRMHWEIEIVPRSENFGGFELGTGGYLVSRVPEDAAAVLRAAEGVAHA